MSITASQKQAMKEFSPVIKSYLHALAQKGSVSRLVQFLHEFSGIPTWSPQYVQKLRAYKDMVVSEQQHLFTEFWAHVEDKYPTPSEIQAQVAHGKVVDITGETDGQNVQHILKKFVDTVKSEKSRKPFPLALDSIGKIPLLQIHDQIVSQSLRSLHTLDVIANPGLSIKDVMARQMIEDALASKQLTRDTIMVEATSGNTGVGMAIIAVHYGLKLILSVPDKVSREKIERLRAFGAHVVIAPTRVDPEDPRSYYSVRDTVGKLVNGWTAHQYDNLSNRKAHELVTGPLIWEHTKGKVTTVIATVGTGGTISGIGRYLKTMNPDIKIIGVDPVGSIVYLLKQGYSLEEVYPQSHSYTIQGFGEDIHPQNYDFSVIDEIVRITDMEGLTMTRMLPLLGIIMGQSTGAVYTGLIKCIDQKLITKNDTVVTIFPDIGIPYRHDVYSDRWLAEKGYDFDLLTI